MCAIASLKNSQRYAEVGLVYRVYWGRLCMPGLKSQSGNVIIFTETVPIQITCSEIHFVKLIYVTPDFMTSVLFLNH